MTKLTSPAAADTGYKALFRPLRLANLSLPNRIVMAPMTRRFAPGGVPGEDVVAYYRRRAEGKVGLIITEGTYIATPSSGPDRAVPFLWGPETEAAWRKVVDGVHALGGHIFAQLWHIGQFPQTSDTTDHGVALLGPSGLTGKGERRGEPMTEEEIADVICAYGESAAVARRAGFDGIEIHAAHGYLIDQFFWSLTNRRTDEFGGDLVGRTRFAVEVLKACRRRVGPQFPISLRISQWKIQDYTAILAATPVELERFLHPLADAGVDIFHCSTRRYWEPQFPGSDLNLAGWTKKLTGLPTVTVGSVTLDTDITDTEHVAHTTDLARLVVMLERGDFDLVAVGRAMIANPNWAQIVRGGDLSRLAPYDKAAFVHNLN